MTSDTNRTATLEYYQMATEIINSKLTDLKTDVEQIKHVNFSILEVIRDQMELIEKSLLTKESHYMTRAVRSIFRIRKNLNCDVLVRLVNGYYPNLCTQKTYFTEFFPEGMMETDSSPLQFSGRSKQFQSLLPEVEVFLHLLLLIFLIDNDRKDEAIKCSNLLMERLSDYNRRSMDMIAAKCYFYHSIAYEISEKLDSIRSFLYVRLRTCTLRKDYHGQASIINLLLRNYLAYNLYDQANKLVSKVTYPEDPTNNDLARYLYYLGRIKAIQLDYSAAHQHLTSALSKAPQNTAVGFKQAVHKLNTVVELLLGEQPDRAHFRNPMLKACLSPYLQLAQSVRAGDLEQFNKVLENFGNTFLKDQTYTLVVRLRQNVITSGVRLMALSYSCISLENIAAKLQLGSPEDAELIVAKAIKDSVIDARICHDQGYVFMKESQDVYSTGEPFKQFDQRMRFCLDIDNQSVKAMKYPSKYCHKELESAEDRREREQQELESANNLSDDDFDEF